MESDDARQENIEKKLDRIIEALPLIEALGELVINADYVTKAKRLNRKTISQNDKLEKYNGIAQRKLLITLESVAAIKNRKRSSPR